MSRRSTNNVSLFPFLAVLVCAMGALILLLLVTTRQIRSNQLADIEAQREAAEQAAVADEPEAVAATPPPAVPSEEPVSPIYPIAGPDILDETDQAFAETFRDEEHAEQDARVLAAYQQELDARLQMLTDRAAELRAELAELSAGQNEHGRTIEKLDQQTQTVAEEQVDLEETQRRLQGQLAALSRALEEAESRPKNVVSKYRLIPFDGVRGTVRRPILIECVDDTFRFLPEGIELSKAELENFLSGLNPLLSGATALSAYWRARDKDPSIGDPYVLLVIRPSGSLGFYTAKRMLKSMRVPIGYELLGETQELDLPAADPGAVQALRLAIQRTLSRRAEIAALRPMTEPFLARQRASAPQGGSRAGAEEPVGRHEQSFRRLLAGVRTQNARRPPAQPSIPADTPLPQAATRSAWPRSGNTPTPPQGLTEPGALPWVQPDTEESRSDTTTPGGPPAIGSKLAQLPDFNRPGTPGAVPQDLPAVAAQTEPGTLPPANPTDAELGNWLGTRGNDLGSRGGDQSSGISGMDSPRTAKAGVAGPPSSVTDGSTKPVDLPTASTGAAGGVGSISEDGARSPSGGNPGSGPPGAGAPGLTAPQQRVIRFRRAVDLFVDPDSVIVADNSRIRVDQADSSGPWLGAIMVQIESEVKSWGPAPAGMQWAPEIRFRVSPGATRTHTRLRNALLRLGIRSTDEFTLGPRRHTSRDGFQAAAAVSGNGARP